MGHAWTRRKLVGSDFRRVMICLPLKQVQNAGKRGVLREDRGDIFRGTTCFPAEFSVHITHPEARGERWGGGSGWQPPWITLNGAYVQPTRTCDGSRGGAKV